MRRNSWGNSVDHDSVPNVRRSTFNAVVVDKTKTVITQVVSEAFVVAPGLLLEPGTQAPGLPAPVHSERSTRLCSYGTEKSKPERSPMCRLILDPLPSN